MSYISSTEKIIGKSILVNPNLGHPIILNLDDTLKNNSLKTHLLYISSINDPKRFEKHLKNKLTLIPILEYKWKLKLILEKMRKEIELTKKKGFWGKWKEKRRKRKEKKLKNSEKQIKQNDSKLVNLENEDDARISKLKPRAFRGDPIIPFILEVKKVSITDIDDLDFDEYCSPRDYLIKHNVYRNLDVFYNVLIEFILTEEVIEFLKRRNFVMFDIVQKIDIFKNRINYHSIVVSKQNWNNFSFIHATDLHIAERNDKIYEIIKKWTKIFSEDYLNAISKEYKKNFDRESVKEKESLIDEGINKPLKKRFINPNNQFRRFIKIMNRKVIQNEIDFIVLTGDLIDFTLLSKYPKELRMFDYNHSNWKIFKEIVLNLPQKKRKGMIKGEELLCPIFTIPGNHDYRPFHYDLRWAGIYRKMGLKSIEALALNDKLLALPISAIIKTKKALKGYWLEINSSLDYYLKLGNSNFIFLNSGSDSFKNLSDFISGHPSLTGLKKKQIIYLENIIKNKISQEDNTFLFLHGPVINPKKKIGLFKRIKYKFGKKILTRIEDFSETMLKKLGKKTSKIRIDQKFNVKFGTVSSNWEKLIKFCKDYCVLTMTGHTHTLKEFRLGDPENKKSKVIDAPPFSLKKIENPAAIFFDTYSEIFTNAKDIEHFGPFVVQTPALGLGGYRRPRVAGAYREVKLKNGKLSSFKVKYIHR